MERFPFRGYARKPRSRARPERPPPQEFPERGPDAAERSGFESRSVAQEDAAGFRLAEPRRAREDFLVNRLEAG